MKFIQNKFIYLSIVFVFFAIFLVATPKVFASTNDNIFGYAWSDNIGWINFNSCENP